MPSGSIMFGGDWKLLETLMASGYISALDLALAKELLKDNPDSNASAAALICHLSLAARRGHLCIQIEDEKIWPSPYSSWSENCFAEKGALQADVAKELLYQIEAMIVQAANKLPTALLTDVDVQKTEKGIYGVQTPLCRMGSRFYFQRYWFYETLFLQHYQQFTALTPTIMLDPQAVAGRLQQLDVAKGLLPEQISAILNACNNALTIICGGPGTGKTFTAGVLICTLWDALTEVQREKFEISLVAPTGKAAANLQKSLLKAAKGVDKLSSLQSKTLHALLGIKGGGGLTETLPISSDLVIVDESSMIDVRLMGALFAAMKPGARLILLGDGHQLPAVEAGSLFADLVQSDQNATGPSHITRLNKCLRAELQGIIDVATAINCGDGEGTLSLFQPDANHSELQRLSLSTTRQGQAMIGKELAAFAFESFKMHDLANLEPHALLNHFNGFRILSPLRKGPFGVEEINRLLGKEYKTFVTKGASKDAPFIAPIMLLKNDYNQELFNGEVGVLVRPAFKLSQGEFELSRGDYALFAAKAEGVRRIPALLLPAFEYAYCLSVHKSQGSEFDHLLLLLPSGAECFGRELLYTAVTRARRQLTLWTDDATLKATVQRKNCRLSGVSQRIHVTG